MRNCGLFLVKTLPPGGEVVLMPDKEETRLLAALKDCRWLSRVATDALTRPMHCVIVGSDAHRKLVEADGTASMNHAAALLAWRTYSQEESDTPAEKSHASGGGA
jgi:hypothetical protein